MALYKTLQKLHSITNIVIVVSKYINEFKNIIVGIKLNVDKINWIC